MSFRSQLKYQKMRRSSKKRKPEVTTSIWASMSTIVKKKITKGTVYEVRRNIVIRLNFCSVWFFKLKILC